MSKPIDKSKKANIKCEHCEHFDRTWGFCTNELVDKPNINYWNRCKRFRWARNLTYKENDNETNN